MSSNANKNLALLDTMLAAQQRLLGGTCLPGAMLTGWNPFLPMLYPFAWDQSCSRLFLYLNWLSLLPLVASKACISCTCLLHFLGHSSLIPSVLFKDIHFYIPLSKPYIS